jgi:hypothetical protein
VVRTDQALKSRPVPHSASHSISSALPSKTYRMLEHTIMLRKLAQWRNRRLESHIRSRGTDACPVRVDTSRYARAPDLVSIDGG